MRTSYLEGVDQDTREVLMARTASRPDDIVVFLARREPVCDECGEQLGRGAAIRVIEGNAVCLACADLDHLVYLPRGDAALTRRAGKYSRLRAVVVRWSPARKRYERQGTLVEEGALDRAEIECEADADQRAVRRAREEMRRAELDLKYIADFERHLDRLFPECPPGEARAIAQHACRKHSGRVGRSAAARRFEPEAIRLAVVAHIRHQHTRYDELLMRGWERHEARLEVAEKLERLLDAWSGNTDGRARS
jgi:hypothetical protein